MSTNVGGAKKQKKPVKGKKPVVKGKKTKGGRAYQYAEFQSDPAPPPTVAPVVVPVMAPPVTPPVMPPVTPPPMPAGLEPAEMPPMDGGAKKKKKVKRKPGKYALFVKAHYDSVAKAHPKWKATDCIKEIAKMWKAKKDK